MRTRRAWTCAAKTWLPVSLKGQADLTASHCDLSCGFAGEGTPALFLANPAQYAPQYGGFCQMRAALGKKLDGDPQMWRVADGKLFVYAYPATNVREGRFFGNC